MRWDEPHGYSIKIKQSAKPVVPSVEDGVRTTKDKTVSSFERTDRLGAILDRVDSP